MEDQLINVEIINELIKKSPYGIALSEFDCVNTCVGNRTIALMLWELQNFDRRITETFRKITVLNTLRININKILAHPNIDFLIQANRATLINIIFYANANMYMDVETLEIILKYHKINPDAITENNSVALFVTNSFHHPQYTGIISTLIKYGANIELNRSGLHCDQQLYGMSQNREPLQIILHHTAHFYGLKYIFGNYTHEYIDIIFTHILMCGKISSLQHLNEKDRKSIRIFEDWLRNIRQLPVDIEIMRTVLIEPINEFNLIPQNQNTNSTVRKMCIFRQNLECLTQRKITVPAYKYYHIAIIILFLMNNPKLIDLSRDILRGIASFVFNY
uniref:Ankyrin repeat protein n=1 Tax=viral metagenome TaxID=1070528 RepID=A0A6C0C619_9ZZZZ